MSLFTPTEAQRRTLNVRWRRYEALVRRAASETVTAAVVNAERRAIEDLITANERGFDSAEEARR